ncbi:AhpD-like protein [Xylariaceae sp. AK1471]|nr:AhpD-like protein [Xylariaceae sp. AK1471]
MRLPYVDESKIERPEDLEVVDRIRARRTPGPLQALDRTLLHSSAVADGWNSFLGAIRTRTSLPPAVRELIICRVAVCNGARYEWDSHSPLALRAGVSTEAMDLVESTEDLATVVAAEQRVQVGLREREWAALLVADEMTRRVVVSDQAFALLRAQFSETEIVEIVATAGCYNCVSRFLVALDVGEKNDKSPKPLPFEYQESSR